METVRANNLSAAQRDRLDRFNVDSCVDMHCHCLGGLDDGPDDMSEAIGLCRSLVADGVTHAIATPHQLGRYETEISGQRIIKAVDDLNEMLVRQEVPLQVAAGAEIRVDPRVSELLQCGQLLSLAQTGRYVLLELPHETFVNPLSLLRLLTEAGVVPVIAHPERCDYLANQQTAIVSWLNAGAVLQLTAASLVGLCGAKATDQSWAWLRAGWVSLIASDSHNTSDRRPVMTAAVEQMIGRMGHVAARRLCIENPRHVWAGQPLGDRLHSLRRGAHR
jgi:protein-tyrosine phosphatase